MVQHTSDVIIIGAGPAGSSASIELAKNGLSVTLIDKRAFPRDKICGDALSVDVVKQLAMLSPALARRFGEMKSKMPSMGVRIFSPNGDGIDIPFRSGDSPQQGYVCRRKDFDSLLLDEVRSYTNVHIIENCEIKDIRLQHHDVVAVSDSHGSFAAPVILGADGAHSVVKRKLGSSKIDPDYHSAGLRVYYHHVSGFNEGNFIELYFLRDILPGYLWVFPLPDGYANVGIGMLTSDVSLRKINLNQTLQRALSTHPLLAHRFSAATALEAPRGHGLPLGGAWPRMSGERFLLAGDAASMIDPFSGEGIGNAIRSGRFAARQIIDSFAANNFTERHLRHYDQTLRGMLRNEFRVSRGMLQLSRFPRLFNTIVTKANRNARLHKTLIDALAYPEKKSWLISPAFYLDLILRS